MARHIGLGKLGEDLAVEYLKKKGFRIIERNYRQKWGELDVVAVSPDKTLVIIEVKTVSGSEPRITGENQMTASKLKKLRRAVEAYVNEKSKELTQEGWRIDLIAIIKEGQSARVRHYGNI